MLSQPSAHQSGEESATNNRKAPPLKHYLSKRDFKELFRYEENERDKKALKKDWKKIEKRSKSNTEFKHVIGKCSL